MRNQIVIKNISRTDKKDLALAEICDQNLEPLSTR